MIPWFECFPARGAGPGFRIKGDIKKQCAREKKKKKNYTLSRIRKDLNNVMIGLWEQDAEIVLHGSTACI